MYFCFFLTKKKSYDFQYHGFPNPLFLVWFNSSFEYNSHFILSWEKIHKFHCHIQCNISSFNHLMWSNLSLCTISYVHISTLQRLTNQISFEIQPTAGNNKFLPIPAMLESAHDPTLFSSSKLVWHPCYIQSRGTKCVNHTSAWGLHKITNNIFQ